MVEARSMQVRRFFAKHRRWFKVASDALNAMFAARGGGKLAHALAAFSTVGIVLDAVLPSESGLSKLREMGLSEAELAVGGWVCDALMRARDPEVLATTAWGETTYLWRFANGEPMAGAVYYSGKYSAGPFVRDIEDVLEVFRAAVWEQGPELRMVTTRSGDHAWRGSGRFGLSPLHTLGPYIGTPTPEWYAARLSRYAGPRTVLLRGPTGAGKSVLARHIARRVRPNARTLKISGEVLGRCRSDEVCGLVEAMQPTVLLLDDLELQKPERVEFFLDMLEGLRAPHTLVLVTMMTDLASVPPDKPGGWHLPGMRAGRIDEMFVFGPPDADARRAILQHYADAYGMADMLAVAPEVVSELVTATEGLTGAFLGEVMLRLSIHGVEGWRYEVDRVLWAAPFGSGDGGEGDDGGGGKPAAATLG